MADDTLPAGGDPTSLALDALDNLRQARRGNAPEDAPGAFTTWYSALVGVAVFVAMMASGVWTFVAPATCTSVLCTPGLARTGVVGALSLALAGLLAWAAAWVGPLGADPARLTWLHSGPTSRSRLLRSRLVGTYVVAALVGAVAGGGAAMTITSEPTVATLSAGAWVGLASSLLLIATAVIVQSDPRRQKLVRRLGAAAGALGVGAAGVSALMNGRDLTQLVGDQAAATPSAGQVIAAGVILTLAAAAVVPMGAAHLDRLRRADLRVGGEAFGAIEASTLMMDGSATTELIASRRVAGHGRYASRRGRGQGLAAHVHRDAIRLSRRGDLAVLAAVALVVPALIAIVIHHLAALALAAFLEVSLCRAAASGYLAWSRSSGLHRMYPQSMPSLRVAYLLAPTLLALGWSLVALTLAGSAPWLALATTCAALAAVLRAGRPLDSSAVGPLLSTPMGAIPLGMVLKLGGQIGLTLLCVGPFFFSTAPTGLTLPFAVVAYQFARAGSGSSSIFSELTGGQSRPPADPS